MKFRAYFNRGFIIYDALISLAIISMVVSVIFQNITIINSRYKNYEDNLNASFSIINHSDQAEMVGLDDKVGK